MQRTRCVLDQNLAGTTKLSWGVLDAVASLLGRSIFSLHSILFSLGVSSFKNAVRSLWYLTDCDGA